MSNYSLQKIKSSGTLSISELKTEFDLANGPISFSQLYKGAAVPSFISNNANIPSSGLLKISDFYGSSGWYDIIFSSTTNLTNLTIPTIFTQNFGTIPSTSVKLRITINPNVTVGNTLPENNYISLNNYAALDIYGFASGSTFNIINYGRVEGGGGRRDNFNTGNGGHALRIRPLSGENYNCKIYSRNGIFAGGGGAGGDGGQGGYFSSYIGLDIFNDNEQYGPIYYWKVQTQPVGSGKSASNPNVNIKWDQNGPYSSSKFSTNSTEISATRLLLNSGIYSGYYVNKEAYVSGADATGAFYRVEGFSQMPAGGYFGGKGGNGQGFLQSASSGSLGYSNQTTGKLLWSNGGDGGSGGLFGNYGQGGFSGSVGTPGTLSADPSRFVSAGLPGTAGKNPGYSVLVENAVNVILDYDNIANFIGPKNV